MLGWDFQRRATAKDAAGRPRVPFEEAVECHDLFGSAYILPWPLLDKRIAGMVEAATRPLEPTEDELRTAVQAVTEAVTAEAARAVARTHPDAAVEVEYALWGTPALRYDGPDQDQAALYERGIPADALLEGALAHTPPGPSSPPQASAPRGWHPPPRQRSPPDPERRRRTPSPATPRPWRPSSPRRRSPSSVPCRQPASPPAPEATSHRLAPASPPPRTQPRPARPRALPPSAATDADPRGVLGPPSLPRPLACSCK